MITVAFIRHGVTAWNRERRIQGHSDQPLSPDGRRELLVRRLPALLHGFSWVASPLLRARETAAILSGRDIGVIATDRRLIEMGWGAWEGELIADLRARYGETMIANEGRGLDFRPPGGETPREVQQRVLDWVDDAAAAGNDVVAVTHKGVIRAIMAHALGWDMTGKAPVRLDWTRAHLFAIGGRSGLSVQALNVAADE